MSAIVPPPEFLQFFEVRDFAGRADSVAQLSGVKVLSWYRDPVRNARVGGDPCSQHTYGLGADYEHSSVLQPVVMARARAVGLIAVRGGPTG
ncbi:MAG: hypothetical protein V3T08_10185, partial [Gemmatimonadota bacterium]